MKLTLFSLLFLGINSVGISQCEDFEVTANFALDSLRDISCFGANDGGAYVHDIDGGILPPYTVTWSNIEGIFETVSEILPEGEDEIDNLSGGVWTVTVSDEEGCEWSTVFEIFEPDSLTLDVISNDPSCFGASDGSLTVNSTGGSGGNIYEIRDADDNLLNVGNSNTANSLGGGTYSITITDENGCVVSRSFELEDPAEIDLDFSTVVDHSSVGECDGSITIDEIPEYDMEEINFIWDGPVSASGLGLNVLDEACPGDYFLTAINSFGCSNTKVFVVGGETITIDENATANGIRVIVKNGYWTVYNETESSEILQIRVIDFSGKEVYQSILVNGVNKFYLEEESIFIYEISSQNKRLKKAKLYTGSN